MGRRRKERSAYKYISEEDAQDIKALKFDDLLKELTLQYQKIGEINEAKKEDMDLKRIKEELKEANEEYKEATGRCSEKIKVIVERIDQLGVKVNKDGK